MIPEPMNPPGPTDRLTASLILKYAERGLREQLKRRDLMGPIARDKARRYAHLIRRSRERLAS